MMFQIFSFAENLKHHSISLLKNAAYILLPLCAFALWCLSLHSVDVGRMNGLGLVSVLPPSTVIALFVLMISFALNLWRRPVRSPVVLLHIALLIFMLYGITALVEEAPRFATVYRHAGYTEYIMRTGSVDPGLDAYFNWPGFFILSAFLTRIAGYHTILTYAAWAPVFFNLIYLGPLYIIFSTATMEKRVIWLGLWFFYLTNWIGQDYFSPQGFNLFLYLAIIAILLKWFKVPSPVLPKMLTHPWQRLELRFPWTLRLYSWLTIPDDFVTPVPPKKRAILLTSLIAIFALSVSSHPLTPFMIIISVATLVIFNRCTPRWLPILMVIMTAVWIAFMARTYVSGHVENFIGDIGQLGTIFRQNVSGRVEQANPERAFISEARLVMTLFIWGLACIGAIRRMQKGHQDLSLILLAVAPFSILLVQGYGGEMLLRVYFFTLASMSFFAATLFYSKPATSTTLRMRIGIIATVFVLLGGFLFTRYGNERMDYMTNAEIAGVQQLYNIAPPGSMLIAGWDGTPWQFKDYEQYNNYILDVDILDTIDNKSVANVVQFIENAHPPRAYMIFTRSQKVTAESDGLKPGMLDQFEHALVASGMFKQVYSNSNAQILVFTGDSGRGKP